MAYAMPQPERKNLDDVIGKIDAALPKIGTKGERRSSSKIIKLSAFKKTQSAFEQMSEDSLLTEDGKNVKLERCKICNEDHCAGCELFESRDE